LGNVEPQQCYLVVWVAFREVVAFPTEVASGQVLSVCDSYMEVHLFLYVSSLSKESLRCHFGKECICPVDFVEASPGVFRLQPLPFHTV
jgi:hypothetical protein